MLYDKKKINYESRALDLCLFFEKFIGLDLENGSQRNFFFNIALEL